MKNLKKTLLLSLILGLGTATSVYAQQTSGNLSVKTLGATVTDVRFSESGQAENGGMTSSVTVKITPNGETTYTSALCFQEGEMEFVYNAGGYSALEMFNLYEEAYKAQKGGSSFREGIYDTTFNGLWDTCNYEIFVCCVTGTDTLVISQVISSKSASGLNDLEAMSVNIFPNPAREYITVQSQGDVTVTNSLGQTVYTSNLTNQENKIDIHAWDKGMYFVKINDKVFKVIKQ